MHLWVFVYTAHAPIFWAPMELCPFSTPEENLDYDVRLIALLLISINLHKAYGHKKCRLGSNFSVRAPRNCKTFGSTKKFRFLNAGAKCNRNNTRQGARHTCSRCQRAANDALTYFRPRPTWLTTWTCTAEATVNNSCFTDASQARAAVRGATHNQATT